MHGVSCLLNCPLIVARVVKSPDNLASQFINAAYVAVASDVSLTIASYTFKDYKSPQLRGRFDLF